LAGAAGDRALLDRDGVVGIGRFGEFEDPVMINAAYKQDWMRMTKRDLPNVIVGLGKTGFSCARYLAKRGESFVVVDSRESPPGLSELLREFPQAALSLGGFDEALLARAQRLIVSPGVALTEPAIATAVRDGAEAIGDIELFARAARAKVVAVTGANGKSTVTTLVGEMIRDAGFKVRVGGNLGTPALDLLADTRSPAGGIKDEPDFYVLELSSFQLETTYSLNAAAAAVLNISPDHMDRYHSVSDYAAAKQRIFRGDGVMVINGDDPAVSAMVEPGRKTVHFGLSAPAPGDFGVRERQGEPCLAKGEEILLSATEMHIKGRHNIANALAALALGDAIGVPVASMLTTLRRFAGLPHRTQWVASRDGVTWYNDSKGTNLGATLAALQGMPGKVVLIAGGLGKGQDFRPLKAAAAAKARAVVLMGQDAPMIEAALAGAVPVVRAATMEAAVEEAARLAKEGDTVLLSPACASFDMFKGYDHRGEVFSAAVRRKLAC
jgi:UDP-N-acetylmuramoylalanine--D-glutamate ligase